MRRADRLFQLIQIVRGRRLTTAAQLAQRLEVSERTVYRDIADLQHQGVPLEGEAGVGYRLGKGFEVPPLLFSAQEAQALVAAMRLAQPWLDPELAAAAELAVGRVLSVLPPGQRTQAQALAVFAPPNALALSDAQRATLGALREAAQARVRVRVHYQDANGSSSQRVLRPLGCFFWGGVWTVAAWCELRQAFRSFRLDRITQTETLPLPEGRFADQAGHTLADFVRAQAPQAVSKKWGQGV